jgi:HSP20 family protein
MPAHEEDRMSNLSKRNEVAGWDPFREIEELSSRLSKAFGQSRMGILPMPDWTPRANVNETPEAYEIQVELPQMKKEDVKVTFEHGVLTMSGERKYEKKEGGGNRTLRTETAYGCFVRSFSLPEDADPERVDARYENGMLNVKINRLPQRMAPAVKTIPVK